MPAVVPAGYVYVPAGRFLYGSADDPLRGIFFNAQPMHPVEIGSFLIARHEVTFADWIEFLRALPAEERRRRMPRVANEQGMVRLDELAGAWRVTLQPEGPAGATLSAAAGEPLRYPGRVHRSAPDWRRFPVSGISWADVLAYAAWLDGTNRAAGRAALQRARVGACRAGRR